MTSHAAHKSSMRHDASQRETSLGQFVKKTKGIIRGVDLSSRSKTPPPVPPKNQPLSRASQTLSALKDASSSLTVLTLSQLDISLDSFLQTYPTSNSLTHFTIDRSRHVSLSSVWNFLYRRQDNLQVVEMDRWVPWIPAGYGPTLLGPSTSNQRPTLRFPAATRVILPVDWVHHIICSCSSPLGSAPPAMAVATGAPSTTPGANSINSSTNGGSSPGPPTSWSNFSFSSEPLPLLTSITLVCRSENHRIFAYNRCAPFLDPIFSSLRPRVIGVPSSSAKLHIGVDALLNRDQPWELDRERAVLTLLAGSRAKNTMQMNTGALGVRTTMPRSNRGMWTSGKSTPPNTLNSRRGHDRGVALPPPDELGTYAQPSGTPSLDGWDLVSSLILEDYPLPSDQFTALPLTRWVSTFFPGAEKVTLSAPQPETAAPNIFPGSSTKRPPLQPQPTPTVQAAVTLLKDSFLEHWTEAWFPSWTKVVVEGIEYQLNFGDDLSVFPLVDPASMSYQISALSDALDG